MQHDAIKLVPIGKETVVLFLTCIREFCPANSSPLTFPAINSPESLGGNSPGKSGLTQGRIHKIDIRTRPCYHSNNAIGPDGSTALAPHLEKLATLHTLDIRCAQWAPPARFSPAALPGPRPLPDEA